MLSRSVVLWCPSSAQTLLSAFFVACSRRPVQSSSPTRFAQSSPCSSHAAHSFSSAISSTCVSAGDAARCGRDACVACGMGRSASGGGGDRLRFGGDTLFCREDAGELLVLAMLGGYACTTVVAPLVSIILGVTVPDPVAVAVVAEDDFGSSAVRESRDVDRARGNWLSMSRGCACSSSSSSKDPRNRGSVSGSAELRGESDNATEELCAEALTIESISQNCKMFIMIGKSPIVLPRSLVS